MSGDSKAATVEFAAKTFMLLFIALFGITLVLAFASFLLGLYTAFFTTLTPGLGASSPVLFYLWLGPFPIELPLTLPFGVVFATMIAVYVIMFAVAATRGTRFTKAFSEGVRGSLSALFSSDLVVAIVAIGFLAFTATAIDTVTQATGVKIGTLSGSDAMIFISTATSPLIEEIGFRVCIIGLVALILSAGMRRKDSLRALWRPASVYEGEELRTGKVFTLLVALVASSVVFGLAHVTSGSGWEVGKLPEATFGGFVLGYLYIKYGLHIAVLTHWGVDYLGTVFSFFGEGAYGIPWSSEPGYVLQQYLTIDLIAGIGLFSFLIVAYLGAKKLKEFIGRQEVSSM